MKGLEIAEKYYLEFGREMIDNEFSDIKDKIAVGLAGSGSECFGFDDDISRDHDFEPGFCIFIPDESVIDRKTAFLLERAYAKLPKEFMGMKKSLLSPVGGGRHGVIRIPDFFTEKTGTPDANLSTAQWLFTSENALLASTGATRLIHLFRRYLADPLCCTRVSTVDTHVCHSAIFDGLSFTSPITASSHKSEFRFSSRPVYLGPDTMSETLPCLKTCVV